jgi:hypothetical protein
MDCIIVLNERVYEQKTIYIVEVASELLPPGCNGMQDIIVEGDHVRFKKDCDVQPRDTRKPPWSAPRLHSLSPL